MRLVDNDEVVRIVREEVKDEDNTLPVQFRAGVDYVLKIMNELPTVDVIPIEWIVGWLTKQTIPATHTCDYYDAVEMMLDDWEKENER